MKKIRVLFLADSSTSWKEQRCHRSPGLFVVMLAGGGGDQLPPRDPGVRLRLDRRWRHVSTPGPWRPCPGRWLGVVLLVLCCGYWTDLDRKCKWQPTSYSCVNNGAFDPPRWRSKCAGVCVARSIKRAHRLSTKVMYVEAETSLKSFVTQRRRWNNGTINAFWWHH